MEHHTTGPQPQAGNVADSRITKKMLQALAPLPDTAMRLLSLLDDPDIPLREIASVSARDVGLSATMLRMANSSMFGLRGRVGSVSDALRVIGTAQARLLVLASGVSQVAQKELPHYGLAAGAFMRHSELVANTSMYVGYELRFANIGIAYSAGLLHDIGKIVINGVLHQDHRDPSDSLQAALSRGAGSLLEAEQALCGADHAQVGRRLAELWALPAELAEAIGLHHDDSGTAPGNTLAWCVNTANAVASAVDSSYPDLNRVAMPARDERIDVDKIRTAAGHFQEEVARGVA